MQPENGGGPPGVRRDPVGGVGASRHQDIWNRAEDAEIQVVSPLPAILAPRRSRNQTVGSGRHGVQRLRAPT